MTASMPGMIPIPAGRFLMGCDNAYPEERPAHLVEVDAFAIDATAVTNAQFRAFVEATGHVTRAEIAPTLEEYPDALPHMLKPGSLVFRNSLLLSGGAEANDAQCEALIRYAVETCERYFPAVQFVVWGGRSAEDALESSMIETMGEA